MGLENVIGRGDDYYGEKKRSLRIFSKIQLKCDVIDGCILKGVKQPILYIFVLDKPPGYKVFCEPETVL